MLVLCYRSEDVSERSTADLCHRTAVNLNEESPIVDSSRYFITRTNRYKRERVSSLRTTDLAHTRRQPEDPVLRRSGDFAIVGIGSTVPAKGSGPSHQASCTSIPIFRPSV